MSFLNSLLSLSLTHTLSYCLTLNHAHSFSFQICKNSCTAHCETMHYSRQQIIPLKANGKFDAFLGLGKNL